MLDRDLVVLAGIIRIMIFTAGKKQERPAFHPYGIAFMKDSREMKAH